MNILTISLGLFLIISLYFNLRIINRIKSLEKEIISIANGDFTKTFTINGMGYLKDICKAMNILLQNMRGFMANVNSSTDHVEEYMVEITGNTKRIQDGAIDNSRVISEIAISMENQSRSMIQAFEYTGKIEKDFHIITARTENASEKGMSTKETIKKSKDIFDKLVEKMKGNANNSWELASKINSLENRAREINTIVDSVNEISQNTNLLALNASIEAARAGEMGKGFAVVASEVKKLADQATEASNRIKEMIERVEKEINNIAQEIRRDSENVNKDIHFANDAKAYFDIIVSSTEETLIAISEINNVAKDEAVVISEIREFMENVAAASQQNTSASQEASATTEVQSLMVQEMFSSIKKLNEMTGDLKSVMQSFVKSYEINDITRKKIQEGLEKLKEISKNNVIQDLDKEDSERYFDSIIEKNRHFETINLFNIDGETVAISYDKSLDLGEDIYGNYGHRDYFKHGIEGEDYISDPYISLDSNNYCLAISTPVKNSSGKIIGILMADFRLS